MQGSEIISLAESAKGSPKIIYTIFLLDECKQYLQGMRQPREINIDSATNSLLAFCPDTPTRNKLWDAYMSRKPEQGDITASILTIGDFQAYLSEVLEFTEKSTGGF